MLVTLMGVVRVVVVRGVLLYGGSAMPESR